MANQPQTYWIDVTMPNFMEYEHEQIVATPSPPGVNSKSKSNKPHPFCKVCGDYSTGKHYGTWTCFGCRGFFQRTVRNRAPYQCQFQKNCDISKRHRNKCKYCRFQKCLQEGMQKEAVNYEKKQLPVSTGLQDTSTTIAFLLMAEKSVMQETYFLYPTLPCDMTNYSIQEIYDSYRTDIHRYTEWAKRLPFFRDLEVMDQLALLRAHGAEIVIFESIRRSIGISSGSNSFSALNMNQDVDESLLKVFANFAHRMHTVLYEPFNSLNLSDSEWILLKTLMLLDPAAKGLSEFGRKKVEPLRFQMQLLLEGVTLDKEPGRVSNILLLLARLFHVAADARKITEIVKASGTVRIPKMVEELVLAC